jgi:hypothetical protein
MKQIASSEWHDERNVCKITIECKGDNKLDDIYEQFKGVLEALGFSTKIDNQITKDKLLESNNYDNIIFYHMISMIEPYKSKLNKIILEK